MAKWKEVPLITASEEWDSMVEAARFALDRLTKKGDELADLVEETPSPEAIVRAALERAAVDVSNWGSLMCGHEDVTLEIISDIRALADDPAVVADIIKAAGKDRG